MTRFYSPVLLALLSLLLTNTGVVAADAPAKTRPLPFHGKLAAVDTGAQTITVGKTARVFHLTPETKVTDGAGNASTLSAAVVGEDVGGSYMKDESGTMTLKSVRLGAKSGTKTAAATPASAPNSSSAPVTMPMTTTAPAPAAPTPAPAEKSAPAPTPAPATETATAPEKAKKQRFSGKVVSVDAAASTLVVHGRADQTFTVAADTKFTGVSGLADVTAGEKVSGTYTKSPDGATMTVATLKASK